MERKRIRLIKNVVEDSILLRGITLYLIVVSLFSVWYFLNLSSIYISSIILLTLIGFVFSYYRRKERNILLKILMTIGMMYFLRQFFVELIKNPFDPRIPLAIFLINLNTIHSFDLPTRLDLGFSFFISIILMIIAGIFAREAIFIVFFLFFLLGMIIFLMLVNDYRIVPGYIFSITLSVLFVGFLIFPLLPKDIRIGFRQDIMSQLITRLTNFQGELKSPYAEASNLYKLPEGRKIPPLKFNPEEYYGFAPFLDLRQRGELSSSIIFRVLTPWGIYHRGIAFDTYNGFGWYQSKEEVKTIDTISQPFLLKENTRQEEYLQRATYFIERDFQNNIIFLPKGTERLYYPSPIIFKDSEDGYRSPFELPKGLIYTGFYQEQYYSTKELLETKIPPQNQFLNYLQLPNIPKRVKDLTFEITKGYQTPWEKLMAIKNYLEDNYEYSLDIPPLPDNEDAVDNFLFEVKKGYCEQFATAFAVMARIIGVPSRLVTGYGPGDLNPWTGMYEVKVKNAHAWVEIYLEPLGWITIDPTPFALDSEERERKESANFLGIIFNSIGIIVQNVFVGAYKVLNKYQYIVIPVFVLFSFLLMRNFVNFLRLTEEDRIFRRVIKRLKRKGFIKEDVSLYNMLEPLGDLGRNFAGLYYALKFAPLNEEEKRKYKENFKEQAKKLLSYNPSTSREKVKD
ncbi:MAG: transglutaminase domain-containing protein [Dictyoglomus turgidum]|uniref:transglutaminase family protein n=1 Tax=Dictyoglomus turgidum TaxID=513050 RepID=UPI003C72A0DF